MQLFTWTSANHLENDGETGAYTRPFLAVVS